MELCLSHPQHGYYQSRYPFGRDGDFITAPEISQIFGEMIGIWILSVWQLLGAPQSFNLVEVGPGRGTLMSDILRTLAIRPEVREGSAVHLVETSRSLRDLQKKTLSHWEGQITWHDRVTTVPPQTSILIANEFLDALPIQQFIYRDKFWSERRVTLNDQRQLEFCDETVVSPLPVLEEAVDGGCKAGDIVEVRPGEGHFLEDWNDKFRNEKFALLFIDYGYTTDVFGDTLQAVQAHEFVAPLENPGQADLTSHINFARLARQAQEIGLNCFGPISQSHFLLSLGLKQRLERLVAAQTSESPGTKMSTAKTRETEQLISGAKRLIDPNQMGDLFKVLAVASSDVEELLPFSKTSL
ncbi:MAG: class I SAM-dependent methyltransferase, partial [Methyloligellaceae bacterium]